MSVRRQEDRTGRFWQYHSRSDHHSKVACWGVVVDLLHTCTLLRSQVEAGKVAFGINHQMVDFEHDRKKDLDLVLCTPASSPPLDRSTSIAALASTYGIVLDDQQRQILDGLPVLMRHPVGSVLVALEAKACMTAHQRALPRLYDELNSSHVTIHGASEQALAVGLAMINIAPNYMSPDLNKNGPAAEAVISRHKQPRDASITVDKIKQIPRRSSSTGRGYDAIGIIVVDCPNDGSTIRLIDYPPAPQAGDIYHYAAMIDRLSGAYASRFQHV